MSLFSADPYVIFLYVYVSIFCVCLITRKACSRHGGNHAKITVILDTVSEAILAQPTLLVLFTPISVPKRVTGDKNSLSCLRIVSQVTTQSVHVLNPCPQSLCCTVIKPHRGFGSRPIWPGCS